MDSTPASEIREIVRTEEPRLRGLAASDTHAPRAHGKWSRRQVLGHLIDSALNNHQRFVRGQLSDVLELPGYSQEDWVRCQGYAEADWSALVELWCGLNRHVAHVVERIPPAKLAVPCSIGGKPPVPLSDVIADYIRHVRHHLEQI
jgi:hypothetical protein